MEKGFQKTARYRIAVTGPESTGKSMLAESLAKHFNTVWVPEYARAYLQYLNRPYEYSDILNIAKGQLSSEKMMEIKANKLLFCDTECIVTKIWSEFKYHRCDPWIIAQITDHPYDLYLLCDVDLPWEYDPLREHPEERNVLFDLYKRELELHDLNYSIVSGLGQSRMQCAVEIIKEKLEMQMPL